MILSAGIDEAGRGPVIGPLIISCIVLDDNQKDKMKKIGVKDSKKLTLSKREKLFDNIVVDANEVIIKIITPEEIDNAVRGKNVKNLNELEAMYISKIISEILSDVKIIYIDSPYQDTLKFLSLLHKYYPQINKYKIIAENKADIKYIEVSAASIVSKVIRDSIIEELKNKYGDFGSGYPSDKKTRNFLISWYKKYKDFPPIVRKSWKTLQKIIDRNTDIQQKLM